MRHETENEYDRIVREEKLEEIARDCRDAMDVVQRIAVGRLAALEPPSRFFVAEGQRARP